MASGQGTIGFDFGSAPGTNVVTTLAVSAPGMSATSKIEIFIEGTETSASHNSYEHSMVELAGFSMKTLAKRTDEFDAMAMTTLRLTGIINARFVWAD